MRQIFAFSSVILTSIPPCRALIHGCTKTYVDVTKREHDQFSGAILTYVGLQCL